MSGGLTDVFALRPYTYNYVFIFALPRQCI